MKDPVQMLLEGNRSQSHRFPPTSRYHGIEAATLVLPEGKTVVYLRRRLIPAAERFALLHLHRVSEGDRLDLLSAQFLGDPEQFWRICDGNGAMRPEELVETPGRILRITLPEGVPGASDD